MILIDKLKYELKSPIVLIFQEIREKFSKDKNGHLEYRNYMIKIPNWNEVQVNDAVTKVKKSCPFLERLVKLVYKTWARDMLCYADFEIPKEDLFVHTVIIKTGQKIFFHPEIIIEKNEGLKYDRYNEFIEKSVEDALVKLFPIEDLLTKTNETAPKRESLPIFGENDDDEDDNDNNSNDSGSDFENEEKEINYDNDENDSVQQQPSFQPAPQVQQPQPVQQPVYAPAPVQQPQSQLQPVQIQQPVQQQQPQPIQQRQQVSNNINSLSLIDDEDED